VTRTGTYSQTFWQTGHAFEREPDYKREEFAIINFDSAFDETPSVAVALKGFDLSYSGAGVEVSVDLVDKHSFKLKMVAPQGARVYLIVVSWIATISDKSNIYVTYFSDNYRDRNFENTVTGTGERLFQA